MRVGLLVTCLVDALFPGVGRATIEVLRRAGVDVELPPAQTCCGQVFVNSGYPRQASALMRTTVAAFADCDAVVTASGSCAGTVRHQYATLAAGGALAAEASALAARTYELSEFLVDQLGIIDVGARYPARVAYHPTCHSLRLLRVGDRPKRLLEHVEDLQLVELPEAQTCCGFGGTFAVKNSDTSAAMLADKVARDLRQRRVCALRFGRLLPHAHRRWSGPGAGAPRTVHLAEILAAR